MVTMLILDFIILQHFDKHKNIVKIRVLAMSIKFNSHLKFYLFQAQSIQNTVNIV